MSRIERSFPSPRDHGPGEGLATPFSWLIADRDERRVAVGAVADALAPEDSAAVASVLRDFARETGERPLESTAAAQAADRSASRTNGIVFVAEPDCSPAFVAAHLAAAIIASNVVAVSLMRTGSRDMLDLLGAFEAVMPRSFVAISTDGRESWARVAGSSTLIVLTPRELFFEHRENVVVDQGPASQAARDDLIALYGEDLSRPT